MSKSLDQQLVQFQKWREHVSSIISHYRDWLGDTGSKDSLQDLRLFDLADAIAKDKLLLAFVAEFSRGKTELINALFFSGYEQRLLPSNPGRTTMCPTEIFWDSNEEPFIKLLPIETRRSDDSISYYKTQPQHWTKLRLDIHSTESMKIAFQSIVQQKEVSINDAKELGLWDDSDEATIAIAKSTGKVDVPVWRHALINFPHPLLKSGLVILDTPGLNALGSEPELTLSILPNAHAVLFLLATDTGVTKSDMSIWTQYIKHRTSRKIAILNKIDVLWDALKTEQEVQASIQTQVDLTATQLNLAPSLVFAISAQKALLAKIKKDDALLAKSNIIALEQSIAQNVVGVKNELLRTSVVNETVAMIKVSRRMFQPRIVAAKAQMVELEGLQGKDHAIIQKLMEEISIDKKLYEKSVNNYEVGARKIKKMGGKLIGTLEPANLSRLVDQGKAGMNESWTTAGLNKNIKYLISKIIEVAEEAAEMGKGIQQETAQLYQLFYNSHGFELVSPPVLDLSEFIQRMQGLEELTDTFCRSPINVMTEKSFLIRKFSIGMIRQIEMLYEDTRRKTGLWLNSVLAPLTSQIQEHKMVLDKRNESLMHISKNANSLQVEIVAARNTLTQLQQKGMQLDKLLLGLMQQSK